MSLHIILVIEMMLQKSIVLRQNSTQLKMADLKVLLTT